MNTYAVKKINLNRVSDLKSYWHEVDNATIHYCNGIKELDEYCGGRLRRGRHGYCGVINNIEYVAQKIK